MHALQAEDEEDANDDEPYYYLVDLKLNERHLTAGEGGRNSLLQFLRGKVDGLASDGVSKSSQQRNDNARLLRASAVVQSWPGLLQVFRSECATAYLLVVRCR